MEQKSPLIPLFLRGKQTPRGSLRGAQPLFKKSHSLVKAGSSKKGATLLSFQRKSLSLEGEGRVRVSLN
jgi:hypothetical protein